ncbi:MAG: hypothetical protein WCQ21_38415 [Verrucomicrobiota bacterium]
MDSLICPESLADDSAKDDFADTAHLVCIAHTATACVMTLESCTNAQELVTVQVEAWVRPEV